MTVELQGIDRTRINLNDFYDPHAGEPPDGADVPKCVLCFLQYIITLFFSIASKFELSHFQTYPRKSPCLFFPQKINLQLIAFCCLLFGL